VRVLFDANGGLLFGRGIDLWGCTDRHIIIVIYINNINVFKKCMKRFLQIINNTFLIIIFNIFLEIHKTYLVNLYVN